MAKLTEQVVASLRGRTFGYGEAKRLAEHYGVSTSTIRRAAHGRTWAES
jgi:DNA-binding MurR/RpiR family transcriptional regulator